MKLLVLLESRVKKKVIALGLVGFFGEAKNVGYKYNN